ncbi:hypothetical protein SK128_022969 [Halocaridina rubra]|uniref:Uncharacterized protein n=1 Tax=Halocaridina rubra TaxID=373956 RepID=A0AAN8XHM5_HALRR
MSSTNMEFYSMSEDEQLRRALQECPIALPPPPNDVMWRNFYLSLYMQVINSEETQRRKYKHKVWDFCVIHSSHTSDQEEALRFANLLTTTLGLTGRTMGQIALGENTLEEASNMVQGSTKVFVLVSKYLENARIPKFVFQEALMQQLSRPDWLCKIVTVFLAGPRINPPFYMANIEGFTLNNDVRTVQRVTESITLEEQMQVRALRERGEKIFNDRLARLRTDRLHEIRHVIADLRGEFGDEYDPTDQITQVTQQINSLSMDRISHTSDSNRDANQVISMSGCQNISVGPSFHFHGRQQSASESSIQNQPNLCVSSSSSSSSPESCDGELNDSSIYFNPTDYASQESSPSCSTVQTLVTLLSENSLEG